MKKNRQYIALLDNGHEYFEFKYESCYRNGSKKNIEDLKKAYSKSCIKNIKFKICDTFLHPHW